MRWIADPTHTYTHIPQARLVAACGLLPQILTDAVGEDPEDTKALYEAAVKLYGYGDYSKAFAGGTVDDAGIYRSEFEEDPPMHPLLMGITGKGQDIYLYQYAMVAIVGRDGTTIITRMD